MTEDNLVSVSGMTPRLTATGRISSYSVECSHRGLNEYREIRSSDPDVLSKKVSTLLSRWEEKWGAVCNKREKERTAAFALQATESAVEELASCESILTSGISSYKKFRWNHLRQNLAFFWDHPNTSYVIYDKASGEPLDIIGHEEPREPTIQDQEFQVTLTLFERMIPILRKNKLLRRETKYRNAQSLYRKRLEIIKSTDSDRRLELTKQRIAHEEAKTIYDEQQIAHNARIDELEASWKENDPETIKKYIELTLNDVKYPNWYEPIFEMDYRPEERILVLDYMLPAPNDLPTLERVSYVRSRDELVEKHTSDAKRKKLYDAVCYQLVLLVFHHLFCSDDKNHIASIVINGIVDSINPATGNRSETCILSIQASKDEFTRFDLLNVDPKACFRELKGIAATQLHRIAPVRAFITLQREDSRFVEGYDVVDSVDNTVNLAAMDWEDFEHLVRGLFESIFSSNGTEVRVTQASRDGGVDAVILDPDPIKGGKIVVQAKRYTSTVGVSAVRDLYGTILNEGANRGILVTTSAYGPDAYKFAKDKPISLITGANLLSLLEEQGHKARIDLAEARQRL